MYFYVQLQNHRLAGDTGVTQDLTSFYPLGEPNISQEADQQPTHIFLNHSQSSALEAVFVVFSAPHAVFTSPLFLAQQALQLLYLMPLSLMLLLSSCRLYAAVLKLLSQQLSSPMPLLSLKLLSQQLSSPMPLLSLKLLSQQLSSPMPLLSLKLLSQQLPSLMPLAPDAVTQQLLALMPISLMLFSQQPPSLMPLAPDAVTWQLPSLMALSLMLFSQQLPSLMPLSLMLFSQQLSSLNARSRCYPSSCRPFCCSHCLTQAVIFSKEHCLLKELSQVLVFLRCCGVSGCRQYNIQSHLLLESKAVTLSP